MYVPQVALHHYVTKSRAEFEAKMARGCGMGGGECTHSALPVPLHCMVQTLTACCAVARQDYSLPAVSPNSTLPVVLELMENMCLILQPAPCLSTCHVQPVHVIGVW